ncbi:LOW QUALITY PROTEIN: tripartite motif-containing protein 43C-like [Apodemus sylvaticus]|uniref:LOW QUALITY PROTEIN: tripartite motif-containing protein 43C-like n=1 Tax=Apodemus sylvaticus TaxID=10129 RepID=UPI0022433C2B|nr:LOW QUALITY PROTEIN: tripartite motif-containing protein 43C-like [Apodemus sylvaticus]
MDILQTSQETLTCLICRGIFIDPVFLRCGHTFCKACLILSSEDIRIPDLCPTCREPSHRMFINNITMKTRVSNVREQRIMKYLNSDDHKCVIHKERKIKFCGESRALLCQLCSDSQDHRGHRHCTIELRVTKQMLKLEKQMASLLQKIQDQQENVNAERRTIPGWLDYITLREEMIRSEYSKLYPPLEEEENQYMACMKNQSNIIVEEFKKSEAMMVHKRSQLIEMYQELIAMSQKPYEVLLLQDLDDWFRRSESVPLTQCVKPKLSAHPNTGLAARFNRFQVKIFFQNLVLFNCQPRQLFNFRRLSFRHHNDYPFLDVPGSYRTSWGTESFTTGKYYWELDLKDHEQWAVGVCYNFWLRNFNIGSEGAFLLVCLKDGDVYNLLTTCPSLHHYIEKPAGRVGVFLDCEGGFVSFLDVAKSSLIYSYCPRNFGYTVRPYYCTIYT